MDQITSLIAILRKKNLLSVVIIILLVVAIPLTIYLVRTQKIFKGRAHEVNISHIDFPGLSGTPPTTSSQNVQLKLTYGTGSVPSPTPTTPPAPTLVPVVSNGCTLRGPATLLASQAGTYSVVVSFPGPAYNSKPTNCNTAGTSCAWVISYQGSNLPPIPTVVDTFTFSENPPGSRPAGNYTLYFVHVNNATPQTPIAICSANITIGTAQGTGSGYSAAGGSTPSPTTRPAATPTSVPGDCAGACTYGACTAPGYTCGGSGTRLCTQSGSGCRTRTYYETCQLPACAAAATATPRPTLTPSCKQSGAVCNPYVSFDCCNTELGIGCRLAPSPNPTNSYKCQR